MPNLNDQQFAVARRVLAELAEMTEHASMTRSLRGGEKSAIRAYNGALAAYLAAGVLPEGMFEPLPEEGTEFGEIAVQTRLLLAITENKGDRHEPRTESLESVIALAPFLNSADLSQLVRERMGQGRVPDGLLVGLAPFLDSETLGQIVRRSLHGGGIPTPTPKPAPEPEPEPAPQKPFFEAEPETMEDLVAQLRRPGLSPEDRHRIAMSLAETAHEE